MPQRPDYGTPNFILPPPNTDQLREAIEREVRRVLHDLAPGAEPGIILDVLVDLRVADQTYSNVDVNIGVIHTLSATTVATETIPTPPAWEHADWYIDPSTGNDTTFASMYHAELTSLQSTSVYWNHTDRIDEQIYRRELMSTIPEPEPEPERFRVGLARPVDWAPMTVPIPPLFPIQPITPFPHPPQRKDLHPTIRAVLRKKDPHGERCVCNDCMDWWQRSGGRGKRWEPAGENRSVWQRLREDYALLE